MILSRQFFQQSTLCVAEQLIGKELIREHSGIRLVGKIVETEAYIGKNDSACHASKGLTPRTKVMFGEAGRAYVYFVYGMHFMFNIVTEEKGFPAAVLIRGVEPIEGLEKMKQLRNCQLNQLTNGPAKFCQAFAIDKNLNGWDLTLGDVLWLEEALTPTEFSIKHTTRVGIGYADKIDQAKKWRFYMKNNAFISRK